MKKWSLWLAPFFLTVFPTLVIYAHNIDQLAIGRMAAPLAYSLLFLFFIGCASLALFRQTSKASVFSSATLLLFFSYGYVYLELGDSALAGLLPVSLNILLLGAYAAAWLAAGWFLYRRREPLDETVRVLTLVGVVLVTLNLVEIVPFEAKRQLAGYQLRQYIAAQLPIQAGKDEPGLKPDIYYVIFDRYGREDVLDKYFSFDNSETIDFLENKGYFVGSRSAANYPNTFLSLSSSLNLTYLDFLTKTLGENRDRLPVYQNLIQTNQAAEFLKSQGYRYELVGDFWDPTKTSPLADENRNLFADFDEFQLFIYERTLANTLRGVFEDRQIYTGVERLDRISLNLNYRINGIKQPPSAQPRFVFAHFLLPHDPVVFAPDCRPMSFAEIRSLSSEPGYLSQMGCANNVMRTLSEHILAKADRPAVVIFQSDEGPYEPAKYFNVGGELVPDNPDSQAIHASILNAIYLPSKTDPERPADYEELGLVDDASPVNTFRVIFNYYFGAELPLLDNRTYLFDNVEAPYNFKEISLSE
jgi:hypothetical protein